MVTEYLVRVLPLASAIAWWAVALLPILRSRIASPFERSVIVFAILVGGWAFTDWIFLLVQDLGQQGLAALLSNLRFSLITIATFVILLAVKWITVGHSRKDAVLAVPALVSIGVLWTVSRPMAGETPSGESLVPYLFWAFQQVLYVGASAILVVHLYDRRRRDMPRIGRKFFWMAGSSAIVLVSWLAMNIYSNVTGTDELPWLSSLLVVPAIVILAATIPMKNEDVGAMFRALSAIQQRVVAVYLFHRSGEPLAALASGRNLPIEAEQLEGVLSVVGNFVETSVPSSRGLEFTAMRYDRLGIVAVRGDFVIAAAVYDGGPAYDTLRSELARFVRTLEDRSWRDLETWEKATKVAERAADELSALLYRPDRTAVPAVPTKKDEGVPRQSL